LNGHVIVKPVVGSGGALLFTQFLGDPERFLDRSYQLAPAIYQEFIPGTEHIRLNCFGARCFAARIQTSDLDWRSNLNVPIDNYQIAPDLHRAVNRVLDHMNLAMGIIDLKRTPDGEIVWLEVNPQGQFLFLEGITGVPLSEHFADYLLSLGGPEHYASSPSAVASPPGERAPGTLDW
jgi:glutathione synthase/RimK-type ligase-like ATP-grasp enzyme